MKLKKLIIQNDDTVGSAKEAIICLSLSYNKTVKLLHKQLWHKDKLKESGTGYTISVNSFDDSTTTINTGSIPQRVNLIDYSFNFNGRQVSAIKFWNIKSPSKVGYKKDDLMALGLNQFFMGQSPYQQYDGDPKDGIYHDDCIIRPKAVNGDFISTIDMTGWYIVSKEFDSDVGEWVIYYEKLINEFEYSPFANKLVDDIRLVKNYQDTTTENNYNTLSQLISRVIYTLINTSINVRTIIYEPDTGIVTSDTNYDTDTSIFTIPTDGVFESVYLDENGVEQTYTQQTINTITTFINSKIVSYLNGTIIEEEVLTLTEEKTDLITINYLNLTQEHDILPYYTVDFSEFGTLLYTQEDVPYVTPAVNTSGGFASVFYQINLAKETCDTYIFENGTSIQIIPPYSYSDDFFEKIVIEPAKVIYLPLVYLDDGKLVQNKWNFIDNWDTQFELYVHEDSYWYINVLPVVMFVFSYYMSMYMSSVMKLTSFATSIAVTSGAFGVFGSITGNKALQILSVLGSLYTIYQSMSQEVLAQTYQQQGLTATSAMYKAQDTLMKNSFQLSFDKLISNAGLSNLLKMAESVAGLTTLLDAQTKTPNSEELSNIEEKGMYYILEEQDDITTYVTDIIDIDINL